MKLAILLEVSAPEYTDISLEDLVELYADVEDEENSVEILDLVYGDDNAIKEACFKALPHLQESKLMVVTAGGVELIEPEFSVKL